MRILLVITCCMLSGCGSDGPFDYERVSGKISYEDGTPIPGGGLRLRFSAQDAPLVEGAVPRPALAHVNSEGGFDCVTSYKYGDGLIPGKHKVAIEMEGGPDARPQVPKDYLSVSTTPLIVDTNDAPFDLKVPKPPASRRR